MGVAQSISKMQKSSERTSEARARKQDYKNEIAMQKYFNDIYNNARFNFEREDDITAQKQGADLYLYHKGKAVVVDEKTATSCYNRDLQTFSFELEFTKTHENNKQTRYPGWFNEKSIDNITNAYMLGYVRAPDNHKNFSVINRLEAIFVKKERVWKYIRKCGYNSAEELIEIFKDAIDNNLVFINEKSMSISLKLNGGLKLVQSFRLQEEPLNILVPKSVLQKISSFNMVVDYKNNDKIFNTYKNLVWKSA